MKVTWTNTFTKEFDLDQAQEDFNEILYWNPKKDIDEAIYDAVEENWYCDGEEYIDTSEAIEICADALRKRIGGVQTSMNLDTYIDFTNHGNDDRSDTWIR